MTQNIPTKMKRRIICALAYELRFFNALLVDVGSKVFPGCTEARHECLVLISFHSPTDDLININRMAGRHVIRGRLCHC